MQRKMIDFNISEQGKYQVLGSEYLLKLGPWMTVRRDHVRLPNGQENKNYYVLEYPDWINVIAITEDGQFLIEKQYRHGLGITEYEICAGVIEPGEEPLAAARRELMEETGFGGGEWKKMMTLCANPSSQNNLAHCFVAKGVKKIGEQHLDRTEDIEPILMTVDEVRELLVGNHCKQALMAAPLWRYFAENHLL